MFVSIDDAHYVEMMCEWWLLADNDSLAIMVAARARIEIGRGGGWWWLNMRVFVLQSPKKQISFANSPFSPKDKISLQNVTSST